jgi:hypothetical protein
MLNVNNKARTVEAYNRERESACDVHGEERIANHLRVTMESFFDV